MRLDDWLSRAAEGVPGQPALLAGERTMTFAELEQEAGAAARRFAGLGVRPGDRVALFAEASIEHAVLLHGLAKLGAVAAPLDPTVPGTEQVALLGALEPALVVREPAEVLEAPEQAAEVPLDGMLDSDAPHSVIHTSGTSGNPKAVTLTYGNHLWNAVGSGVRIGVSPSDRWLCCMPLHHVGGFAILVRGALYRIAIELEPFDADVIAAAVEHRATIVSLVPTMLKRLLDAGAPLDRLRCALIGGGPLPQALLERALDAGVPVAPTYGLTECASQVATMAPGEAGERPGSAGPPILTTELRIDDEGVICVRGPSVAPGEVGDDGWLHTSDVGRLDEEGYLYVIGRADDTIVTGGKNVAPAEVEHVLLDHPGVAEAAVHGREDPEWQEAVVAAVVLAEASEVTEEDLREFCRARLAAHKVPKAVSFTRELPRNAQGKIQRDRLR